MTEIMARFLKRRGHDVTVAHYATLTDDRIWWFQAGSR